MIQTRLIMGMPITVEIVDPGISLQLFDTIFTYFSYVDKKYSPFKPQSEVSKINHGLPPEYWDAEMKHLLVLCERTKQQTGGYFDIRHDGKMDPSGLVKGWAIYHGMQLLRHKGVQNFYIDAGGDIQVMGHNGQGEPWKIGIRNPLNRHEIIKVLSVQTQGVATSGTAIRGQHIYNPHLPTQKIEDMLSLTVIGPNIYEADRFATAAFAMGRKGLQFIERLPGFEAYAVTHDQIGIMTSGLERYSLNV